MAQSISPLLVTNSYSTPTPPNSLLSRLPKRPSFLCCSNPLLSYKANNLPPKNNHTWPLQLSSSSSSTVVRSRRPLSSPGEQSKNQWEQLVFPNMALKMLQNAMASFLIFIQVFFAMPILEWNPEVIPPAHAVLYSPNTNVPRSGDVALRRAIPANSNMKTMQDALEDISFLLRIPQRKPFGTMEADVKKAIKVAVDEKESIMNSFPSENKEKGSMLYTSLLDGKGGLQDLTKFIKGNDIDKIYISLANSLDILAEIELLQAPGLSFLLPDEYLKYPRLTGRGAVEFTIEKVDGSKFFPTGGGEPKSTATLEVVLDGYSAPLTSGNFASLVTAGAYDGIKLGCTNQAILADGMPTNSAYSVPLELMPSGQFEPLYKTMLSVQDGELPVLPLSVYGAVAMSHSADSEEYSSPSQFFFYLYDKKSAGLGGLSFDEGQFSVFGYVTAGRDVLPQIKTGDLIRTAKLVKGQDHLVLPNTS